MEVVDLSPNECFAKTECGSIVVGDALEVLKSIPDGMFKCCVMAPPYWGLRASENGREIGFERRMEEYLGHLDEVFSEVYRVLEEHGTLWLGMGDSYASRLRPETMHDPIRPSMPTGLKRRDLLGIPWRVAFNLQAAGWYLRCDIIWHQPNCQAESVRDRPTRAHEYLFLFSKSEDYLYNYDSVREPSHLPGRYRNRRSVWVFEREPYDGFPVGTIPRKLVELCVRAGSNRGDAILDPFLGSGTVGVVCQELGRRFVGIDISEKYASLAKQRLGWA